MRSPRKTQRQRCVVKAEWIAKVGGEEYGPFTWDQMLQMSAEGRVTPELPIRKASDSQWSTAAEIPGLLGSPKTAAPVPKQAAKPAAPSAATPTSKSAVKKAKPLARPPTGRPVPPVVTTPQNIPAGIPVGAPMGTVAAAPPAPHSPSPLGAFNLDLGASPSSRSRSATKSALDADDEEGVVVRRKSRAPLILGVLGGVTALVAIVVGVTIYITMFRGGNEEQLTATNTSAGKRTDTESADTVNPGEANPEGEADPGARKPSTSKDRAKGKSSTNPSPESDQKGLQSAIDSVSQKSWVNAATISRFGFPNIKVEIGRVWLTGPTSSEPKTVEPPTEENSTNDATQKASTKYLAIEFVISNKASSTLKYKGWNSPNKTPVFLVDDQEKVHKLIPVDSTPAMARLPKADIAGGGQATDVLVFEAPSDSFDELRLLLPQNVFYPKTRNPYFGISITPDVLASGGGSPVTPPSGNVVGNEANDPLLSGRRVATDPALPENPAEMPAPDAKAAAKTEPAPPKKPSLIDEINKSVDEDEKGKKMDEGKGAEAEKKPEPGKKGEPAKKTEPANKTAPKAKK